MECFNKEDVYDNEISPLMGKIIEICQKNNIPMVASFAYENCEDNGVGCCTTTLNTFEDRVIENYADATREITKRTGFAASVMISKQFLLTLMLSGIKQKPLGQFRFLTSNNCLISN